MPRAPSVCSHRILAAVLGSALAVLILGSGAVLAQGTAPSAEPEGAAALIRSDYTKFEAMVPMRDGVRLFTVVYLPTHAERPRPILMNRSPYSIGPYGADRYKERLGPAEEYAREGWIFVYQNVRGKYLSEGEFVDMRPHRSVTGAEVDESTDTYDTIEWLLENVPGHNGKVGLWGISYPGFYASYGAIDSHPALAAVSPQAPIADWFWDDMHRHGAFVLPLAFNFFSSFGVPRSEPTTERAPRFDPGTPDGYRFFLELGPLGNVNERHFEGEIPFWNEIVAHPNYDAFWQSRNLLAHLDGIGAAVLVVGGWFDTEDLYGPLKTYRAIEEANPEAWSSLVMGPWPHGGWSRTSGERLGEAEFGFPTSQGYLEEVELPFFRHFLDGGPAPGLPEALMFETGADRWRRFPAWPPPRLEEAALYLQPGGGLAWEPPGATGPAGGDGEAAPPDPGFDRYVSDPAKPVPYTMEITTRWARDYMTEDQRFAAWRPDVLVYESEPLEADLTLAGPLTADLWVSTSGGDSDWIVKVIDVFPDRLLVPEGCDEDARRDEENACRDLGATQRLVRAEAFRGRFRESYEHPKPFVPNEPTQVRFELQDVLHTWKRGHRVMVHIQSTWFPFIDRNPGTWVPNIFEAEEEDFVPVENRVYRTPERPSAVRVGVLPGGM